ncbi:hypothetical protein EDD86DRAFT_76218 [Gorgonomyces haynaldii]|nr:hypothetical protein EDD86DRAFT_76218 [Gorgonomyces haynaldii]
MISGVGETVRSKSLDKLGILFFFSTFQLTTLKSMKVQIKERGLLFPDTKMEIKMGQSRVETVNQLLMISEFGTISLDSDVKFLCFTLHFEDHCLTRIDIDMDRQHTILFNNTISSPEQEPQFKLLYHSFGPTFPGEYRKGHYIVKYPHFVLDFVSNDIKDTDLLKTLSICSEKKLVERIVFHNGFEYQEKHVYFKMSPGQTCAVLGKPSKILNKKKLYHSCTLAYTRCQSRTRSRL